MIKKYIPIFATLGVLNIFLVGCGDEVTSASVTETSGQMAASSVEEVTEAMPDEAASAGLLNTQYQTNGVSGILGSDIVVSRNCTKDSSTGVVTVTQNYSGSATKGFSNKKVSRSFEISESGSLTRVWTPPTGQSIACNSAATHVQIDWTQDAAVNGLSLTSTFDRERDTSWTMTLPNNKTKSSETSLTAKGTRSMTWSKQGSDSTTITRTKTIETNVERTRSFIKSNGLSKTLALQVKTKAGDPLVVNVVRFKSDLSLKTKTLKSGTLVSTEASGERVELDFNDVVFDMTSSNPCLPSAGTINGSYFASQDSTSPSKTFVISFGADTDSTISISYDGATAIDYSEYNSKGCDLERDS